jgi:hypothetical protein
MKNCGKPGKTCSWRIWRPTRRDPASSLEGVSGPPGSSSGKALVPDSTVAEDTFQRAVKKAMEKLKESDDTIKVKASLLQ